MMPDSSRSAACTAVFLALLLGACASPPTTPTPGPRDTGAVQTGRCQLRLDGEIGSQAVNRLGPALDELQKAGCREKLFVLNTTQGDLGSAITLGSMLRNRNFQTRVAAGATCLTPCWLVWVAGHPRALEPQARIGFSPLPPDEDFGRRQCESELSRAQALTLTRYLRAMLPSAPATALFQRLVQADCRGTVYWGNEDARAAGLV